MALFGNKKDKKLDLPEVVDFSNDTWSYKGNPPEYQIQSDGFTYDVVDADGNDKNAITLGLSGMLVIVLNAKGPKIKEDELLPYLSKVIKTRNWHSMTVKEANFLVQTAIKKLTNSATSGDVFDLASYAPLEVKRVLLKMLFTLSRIQLPAEFREEAEHRIIDDIVPDIFANPDYELALLTGLIVKPDEKAAEPVSKRIETAPVIESNLDFKNFVSAGNVNIPPAPSMPEPEPDSAFAELQKIYGRRVDTPEVQTVSSQNKTPQSSGSFVNPLPEAAQESASAEPISNNSQSANPFTVGEPTSGLNSNMNIPQPNNPFSPAEPISNNSQSANPFTVGEPTSSLNSNMNIPQPNNPFSSAEPKSIPQPAAPNFFGAQPNNPYQQMPYPNAPQRIPQPPVPGYGAPQPNYPFNNAQMNPQMQYTGYPQPPVNPYMGNQQMYPPQMYQQGQMPPQGAQGSMNNMQPGQNQFPPQGFPQNPQGYPQNPNMSGTGSQPYPNWQNPGQNYPQQPNQNPNSNPNNSNS
ncbi:MAG: hypothetical protein II969_02445 [Anaerolineaceae bacterium]|nr:hypothetical protein [Anaerolineaceae bacterium]